MRNDSVCAVSDQGEQPRIQAKVQPTCDPVACRYCGVYKLCLPLGLERADMAVLESIVRRKVTYKRGQIFYRAGKRFDTIYAIRNGSVKTCLYTEDGHMQITGFHIAGELLGLSAIARGHYTCEAMALETTSVCMVDAAQFDRLAREIPTLQHQLLTILSMRICQNEELMLLLGKRSAEQKLAGYLLGLSSRYASRNYSPDEFHLSMSRADIGNYLGIAEETVCRILARLREEKLITMHRRHIRLDDIKRLSAVADVDCICRARARSSRMRAGRGFPAG